LNPIALGSRQSFPGGEEGRKSRASPFGTFSKKSCVIQMRMRSASVGEKGEERRKGELSSFSREERVGGGSASR